jgi:hypothetical protein
MVQWDRGAARRGARVSLVLPQLPALRTLARHNPDAYELAKLVSLAARIDRPLLRAARLTLLSHADAGAEADLWLSPLVQVRSYASVLLNPEAAEALRQALRADGRQRLEVAWAFLEDYREETRASHAIRYEETLHYLSLHPDIPEEV